MVFTVHKTHINFKITRCLNFIKNESTLKVHNPRVIILLICINDVQGKELSFQMCNNYMKVIDNIQQPSLLAIQI